MIHRWSIARRLFVAHLLFILSLTAVVGTATFVDARDHAYDEAGRRMAAVATAVADNPLVLDAASAADPAALLQPYALKVMADADADFITIMAPDRTRWTHPREEELVEAVHWFDRRRTAGPGVYRDHGRHSGPLRADHRSGQGRRGHGAGAGGGGRNRPHRGRCRLR